MVPWLSIRVVISSRCWVLNQTTFALEPTRLSWLVRRQEAAYGFQAFRLGYLVPIDPAGKQIRDVIGVSKPDHHEKC